MTTPLHKPTVMTTPLHKPTVMTIPFHKPTVTEEEEKAVLGCTEI